MVWKAAGIVICLCICYVFWQYLELKRFEVTEYAVTSKKIHKEHCFVVLADLHGFSYGKENERLMERIRELNPQLILIAGDMIVSKQKESYVSALVTLKHLAKIAPVYYAMGNHESRVNREEMLAYHDFAAYYRRVKGLGVKFLQNERVTVSLDGDEICISGLELDMDYYEKGYIVPLKPESLTQYLGEASDNYQILLAHNPAYSEEYAGWGADLTLCGHNHGGLVRLPGIGSLLSPQLTWFPKYNDGCHELSGNHVIISRGLGTHTFHIRIFNRAELIAVRLLPEDAESLFHNKHKKG